MTAEFMALPQNLEAEQSVIGGLLLDDDNSERVQKVLAMLKPESFYSRPLPRCARCSATTSQSMV